MTYLPQPHGYQRAPRVRFAETTPAVLRFQDGHRSAGKLKVVSVTGGLLCLPKPLAQGALVKVMFLTRTGSVLGAAEMLSPVSDSLQPFRFVTLGRDDRSRLQAVIQSSQDQHRNDLGQIDKYRAW